MMMKDCSGVPLLFDHLFVLFQCFAHDQNRFLRTYIFTFSNTVLFNTILMPVNPFSFLKQYVHKSVLTVEDCRSVLDILVHFSIKHVHVFVYNMHLVSLH